MPALCSATYFFISSYVALVSADVISISSSSIVTLINHPAFVSVGTKEQPSQREQFIYGSLFIAFYSFQTPIA
jgi:hypothetical protein